VPILLHINYCAEKHRNVYTKLLISIVMIQALTVGNQGIHHI